MTKITLTIFLALISLTSFGQDIKYARYLDSCLSSPKYAGRGYIDQGVNQAADFLRSEMENNQVQPLVKNYFQKYHFPQNTITELEPIQIDGEALKIGKDFMIAPASGSIDGTFDIVFLPDSLKDHPKLLKAFWQQDLSQKFVLTEGRFKKLKYDQSLKVKGIIYKSKYLIWSASRAHKVNPITVVDIWDTLISSSAKQIHIKAKNTFYRKFKTKNIFGMVKGSKYPDSFLVITAHYDHLGKMGPVMFPGASDNGSGTSMLMDMAKHYAKAENQPKYSMLFLLFSGEEAGLMGSTYCSENPPVKLERIKFLINLDMVGTGSDGFTVVNGSVYPEIASRMQQINQTNHFIKRVKIRGESCNSDHCPFYKKGVPSIFIYSMGKENQEYHSITDTYDKLPFTEYEDIFQLLTQFLNTI